ncbi:MAG TPA: GTPase HflX [Candidatus Avisuccinivibrio pullicola]|nr:GTPase HflX [Candidatus Avisuccinivibrio pullicola]
MPEQEFEPLGVSLLVHVQLPKEESQEDLDELCRLAEAAGGVVCETMVCRRDAPDPRTFIGKGKVEEVAAAVRAHEADVVIFNSSLTPAQERNLEKEVGVRVMDRIALILDIFARRARTYEGKLQVELAQLKYAQARLVRGWTHLERQKGGFGLRGGPGETQIELDRRALRERIAIIRESLDVVARRRSQNRQARRRNALPVISFVGYTNAGKSTLFNALTHAEVFAHDQLFATLDPTLRTLTLPVVGKAVFADTVGFIRHLPHELVAAFSATLEESAAADVLVHVIDAADPRVNENIAAVDAVLSQIGATVQPRLLVFNKSDLLDDPESSIVRDEQGLPVRVNVSAKTGWGLDRLLEALTGILSSAVLEFEVALPYSEGRLRAELFALKAVRGTRYDDSGQEILALTLTSEDAARLEKQSQGALARAVLGKVPEILRPYEPPKALKSSQKTDFNFDFGEFSL